MKFEIRNISCGYGEKCIINDISFSVKDGEILCILGPNGVGKTTLLKAMLGFLKIKAGERLLDGEDISKWSFKKTAKYMSYVPQSQSQIFPFSVIDVVVMGRLAHLNSFASPSPKDIEIAENSLAELNISFLKNRVYSELSGGEKQMVLIARALTQKPMVLFLDEPTANLDFGNQIKVLSCIKRLAASGISIIMTSHFPDHAFLCSATVALLQKKNKFMIGSFDKIVTEKNLNSAYEVDVKIVSASDSNGNTIKTCVPLIV